MKEEIIIGMDIGTGSCKAVAITTSGKVLAETQKYYSSQHPKQGYSEQDPEIIYNAFLNCISGIVPKLAAPPLAVSISSCMHSLMLIDKNHAPLTPLIIWEDSRSHRIAASLRKSDSGKKLYRATGTPIYSMAPLSKIIWFRKNQKKLFSKTAKFIGIKEFIWYRFFGEYQIDLSVASATGLFDIKKLKWYKPALKLCGISSEQLSDVVNTRYIRKGLSSEISKKTGLPVKTPFCIGANDGCLANLGSNTMHKHRAAVSIGTSGAIRLMTRQPRVNYSNMIFNYLLTEKIFIIGGAGNNGGNVLIWLIKTFFNNSKPDSKAFKRLHQETAAISAGSDGLVCLPFLHGERSPVWDEEALGVWFGMTAHHTQAHFLRSAIEGICYTLRAILETLDKKSDPINQLHISGGAFSESENWLQMFADITGKKVIVTRVEDASAMGAALLALQALHKSKSFEAHSQGSEAVYLPNKNTHEIYNKYFRIYKKLYPSLKPVMHEMG